VNKRCIDLRDGYEYSAKIINTKHLGVIGIPNKSGTLLFVENFFKYPIISFYVSIIWWIYKNIFYNNNNNKKGK